MDAEQQRSPVLIAFRADDVLARGIDRAAARHFCSRADTVRKLVAAGLRREGLLTNEVA